MSNYISNTAADVIGMIGTVLFIGGFLYANMARDMDKVLFNAVNLVGAAFLLTSLSVKFNLAAFVLEAAWAIIAFFGLVQALRSRRVTSEGKSTE